MVYLFTGFLRTYGWGGLAVPTVPRGGGVTAWCQMFSRSDQGRASGYRDSSGSSTGPETDTPRNADSSAP